MKSTSAWSKGGATPGETSRARTGANGTNGTNGTNFLTSPSTPTGACHTGDTDLARDSDELWACSGGTWSDIGSNVKGVPATVLNCSATPYVGIDLAGCNLNGINFSGATLYGADLANTQLQNANLQNANVYGANLTNTQLQTANLQGANLSGSNMTAVGLGHANLTNALLIGTNMTFADLPGTNLTGAQLTGASLTGTNWNSTICPDGSNSGTNGTSPQTCIGHGITAPPNGTSFFTSSGSPSGSCNNGDSDLALSTDEVWSCSSGAWIDTGTNIKGAIGATGAQGPAGTNGTNGASVTTTLGNPVGLCTSPRGDIALNTDEVWTCSSSGTWTDTGANIKGATGGTGATGPQGPAGANGISHGYGADSGNVELFYTDNPAIVQPLSLPAGNYLLTIAIQFSAVGTSGSHGNSLSCYLMNGDFQLDERSIDTVPGQASETMTMTDYESLSAATTINVQCQSFDTTVYAQANFTAIAVNALN